MPVPTPTPTPLPAPTPPAAAPATVPFVAPSAVAGPRETSGAASTILPRPTPPDVSGLRELAARLEAHAHTVETCVATLAAALAQVQWRSAAGDLARTGFETRLHDLGLDVVGLRDAGASVLRHVSAVESAPPTPAARGADGVAGSAPMPFRMR